MLIEMKNLSFSYDNKTRILRNASVSFDAGIFYCLVGPSGSGKTTTLALAGALDEPQEGAILFKGKNIRDIGYREHRRKNVALIFQNYNLIPYLTGLENVLAGMNITGAHRENQKTAALEWLSRMKITKEEANRNVNKLSGGQQQRIAIARALAGDAPVILADEPTGNLDSDTSADITAIFKELAHEYNKCVIVVSHSQELASNADVVITFKDKDFCVKL